MNRKQFLSAAGVLLTGTVAGCGGGGSDRRDDNVTIDNPNGSSSADLSRLQIDPRLERSAYIDDETDFFLTWPSQAEAPRTTQVRLYRFLEARGGEGREDVLQDVRIDGNSNGSWAVRPRNFLALAGVYHIDVTSSLDRRRQAFIIESGRTATLPESTDAQTRGVSIENNGGTGSLSNLTLRYIGDTVGPVGIPIGTSFVLQFPSEASAPARMSVNLRRYKERRGDDGTSGDEQRVELLHDAGSNVWTVRRRDNFPLERGATYILEVFADGERERDFPFLTEG